MPNEKRANNQRSSEEEARREKLLRQMRIDPKHAQYNDDDDEIEHDKNYSRNDDGKFKLNYLLFLFYLNVSIDC